MNTQIIHDIMLAQGWKEIHEPVHGWERNSSDGKERFFTVHHPIPDTIDAAVGVIEGAGYVWDNYRVKEGVHFASATVPGVRDSCVSASGQSRDEAVWQLALACVKAGKGKETSNGN